MQKWRLDIEADEWLSNNLEAYQKQHPELDFKKDVLQHYIGDLLEEIIKLQTVNKYLEDAAVNSGGHAESRPITNDSPLAEGNSLPTPEPRADLSLPALTNQPLFRPPNTTVTMKNGETVFTQKQGQAITFAEALLHMKEEHQRKIEGIKTAGARERAEIRRGARRNDTYDDKDRGKIIDGNPYGGPVWDYVR